MHPEMVNNEHHKTLLHLSLVQRRYIASFVARVFRECSYVDQKRDGDHMWDAVAFIVKQYGCTAWL